MSYQLSPRAEADLEEIGDYIADDSPENARRFIELLTSKLEALGRHPMMGRARPGLRSDLRYFPYGSYLILYRIVGDGARRHELEALASMRPAISTISSEPQVARPDSAGTTLPTAAGRLPAARSPGRS